MTADLTIGNIPTISERKQLLDIRWLILVLYCLFENVNELLGQYYANRNANRHMQHACTHIILNERRLMHLPLGEV